MQEHSKKISIMNNTKWDELRLSMYELHESAPFWRTCDIKNGYISEWDKEWFYHFRVGGYETIKWVELKIENELQRQVILQVLKTKHIAIGASKFGYKIYGHVDDTSGITFVE